MADYTNILIVIILLMFNYLVLYKKNKFFGNIAFIGSGIALMSLSTDNIYGITGLIIILGGIISLIYDIINKWRKK